MACGVYAIRCFPNGRAYIGSSNAIARRWIRHREDLRLGAHHSVMLQRAWTKHGEAAFGFDVLEHCAEMALLEREQWHLDHPTTPLFNTTWVAGKPPSPRGRRMSEATKAKLRAKAEARGANPGIRTPEQQAALTRRLRGMKRTVKQKQRMSDAQRARAAVESASAKRQRQENGRKTWLGKHLSAEHRRKLSIALKKVPVNPKAIEGMRRARERRRNERQGQAEECLPRPEK